VSTDETRQPDDSNEPTHETTDTHHDSHPDGEPFDGDDTQPVVAASAGEHTASEPGLNFDGIELPAQASSDGAGYSGEEILPPSRLTSFSTSRPVAIFVIFLAAVVFGLFSYRQLSVALMPELSYPTLTVRTEYPGAAPEEVENDISRPIEEALGVIGGLRRISSISRAGVSDVVLELSWDSEMSQAAQDALEKLDLVFLPDEAERPLILRFDPSLDPVMELSLSGSGERFEGEEGLRRLRRLADLQVKRALEPIKGVAAVRVRGGLEEEIHIRIDEEKLRRSGLPIQMVIDRLAQENVNVAGGTIKEGRTEYMVRTLNEYENLDQIAQTVIARLDGREVRVSDLGQVVWSHKERQILTRTEGGASVQIDIFKEADANIVALAQEVKQRLGKLDLAKEAELAAAPVTVGGAKGGHGGGDGGPSALAVELYRNEGAELRVVGDRSLFIESSIDEVVGAALFGGLFAIVVLFLFLRNAMSTLIVALSIPISLVITFAPLNALGVSLNIMSLGGLALGIGMLVDSSIVVLESIFRCREEGDDLVTAAVRGTREVRGAVIASTLTSIAVFLPMVFVEGIAGQAFGDLGLAVVISLLASLAVAVFFIPMLASRRWGTGQRTATADGNPLHFGSFGFALGEARRFVAWTKRGGAWALLKLPLALLVLPFLLLCLAIALLFELIAKLVMAVLGLLWLVFRYAIWSWLRYGLRWVAAVPLALTTAALSGLQSGYPRVMRWAIRHTGVMAVLTLLIFASTAWMVSGLGSELLPEVHQGEITFEVALPVGTPLEETEATLAPIERAILAERDHIRSLILTVGFDPESSQRSDEGEHTARFKVLLENSDPRVEAEVVNRIRGLLSEVPDIESRVVRPVLFSSKTPIEVEVYGDSLPRLKDLTGEVRDEMAAMPELTDVEATLKSGAPEVQIIYDRDLLARYGLNIRQVAELVRNQVKGFEATRFNLKDRRVPILVQLGAADRETVADVSNLAVNPDADRSIPLSAVAQVTLGEGPSEVRRVDGRRASILTANVGSGSLGPAVDRIEQVLSSRIEWPADMTFLIAGQNEEWERSQGSLLLALALSIFLVYVIMAAQFESLLQPLVIMFTIPLAFFGTMLALHLLGISLSVVVFLGMIMLAGIVVNNAIVLIDYINVLRSRGMSPAEAIITAGTVRLRPILMTTATTVLGLLPMALGLGDGAEIRTPMAIAVISGLLTSTVLTLLIVPAIYALIERLRVRFFGGEAVDAEAVEIDALELGGLGRLVPAGAPASAMGDAELTTP
jgi:HAE1 family hydrophobic/amphiphilic exporter-1